MRLSSRSTLYSILHDARQRVDQMAHGRRLSVVRRKGKQKASEKSELKSQLLTHQSQRRIMEIRQWEASKTRAKGVESGGESGATSKKSGADL